jgi:hypothetical protein
MQFSILMKNEGNGQTNAENAWGLPTKGNQNFQLALINTNIFR